MPVLTALAEMQVTMGGSRMPILPASGALH
jgi:hypothetical protein